MRPLFVLSFAVGACTGSTPAPDAPTSRVDAVAAKPSSRTVDEDAEAWCDHRFPAAEAKPFTWPGLADGQTPPAPGTWRWVNVWATWCGPCVAEMPMLTKWKAKLAAEGAPIDLVFLSVDDGPAVVEKFRLKHPDLELGPRIGDVATLPTWLTQVGLDASVAIPLQFIVDPAGNTRCVRSGSVNDADYPILKHLLTGG